MSDITAILAAIDQGDPTAAEKLARLADDGGARAAQTQIDTERSETHRPPSSSFNCPASQRSAGRRTFFGRNGSATFRPSPAEA